MFHTELISFMLLFQIAVQCGLRAFGGAPLNAPGLTNSA